MAHKESHLIGRESRGNLHDGELLQVSTAPSKWPGTSGVISDLHLGGGHLSTARTMMLAIWGFLFLLKEC